MKPFRIIWNDDNPLDTFVIAASVNVGKRFITFLDEGGYITRIIAAGLVLEVVCESSPIVAPVGRLCSAVP